MATSRDLEKEMATMLSEDLITEILLRLPVKPLSRFRCVCKAWLNLIKSPNFIHMHLNHSNRSKTDRILLCRNRILLTGNVADVTGCLSIHDYESFDLIASLKTVDLLPLTPVCGPCNGIVLVKHLDEFGLYNPSTGECLRLPPRPFLRPNGSECYIRGFGFGFVSNPNDCKVVLLVHILFDRENIEKIDKGNGRDEYKVEIYNLSTDSWRQIECDLPCRIFHHLNGILFNGSLHWIARCEDGTIGILCFDMIHEVFRDMESHNDLPLNDGSYRKSLTVLNDSLAALFAYRTDSGGFIDIWVMKDYGVAESWTKQFSIRPFSGTNRPLLLWKSKAIFFDFSKQQLMLFALDTHEIKEFKTQGYRWASRIFVFEESLISLKQNRLNSS